MWSTHENATVEDFQKLIYLTTLMYIDFFQRLSRQWKIEKSGIMHTRVKVSNDWSGLCPAFSQEDLLNNAGEERTYNTGIPGICYQYM